MLYTSASGLDPHISPEAAFLQISRIARARRLSALQTGELSAMVQQFVEPLQFHLFGEERVNVLKLNIAVDRQFTKE
jgi:K+-transporting ATPase ATPase C chain